MTIFVFPSEGETKEAGHKKQGNWDQHRAVRVGGRVTRLFCEVSAMLQRASRTCRVHTPPASCKSHRPWQSVRSKSATFLPACWLLFFSREPEPDENGGVEPALVEPFPLRMTFPASVKPPPQNWVSKRFLMSRAGNGGTCSGGKGKRCHILAIFWESFKGGISGRGIENLCFYHHACILTVE